MDRLDVSAAVSVPHRNAATLLLPAVALPPL